MRYRTIALASVPFVHASPHVFSVNDDLLAFPQYEVVFSESYISEEDASSRVSYAAAASSTNPQSSPLSTSIPGVELSRRQQVLGESSGSDPTTDETFTSMSYESMILNSIPYLCSIPNPSTSPRNHTTAAKAAEEEAAELARATDRGWDLLQDMSGKCLYFISGWWSYSFCYADDVKQFHQSPPGKSTPIFPPVEDPTTPSYVLGKFGKERINRHRLPAGEAGIVDGGLEPEGGAGSITTIQAKGSSTSRYLSQKLTGGTTCDLTGSPRRVEVQFHCHPQSADRIGGIKEVSTCSYLMVIYTSRLCNDVAFLPPRDEVAESIACREIVKEEDIPAWISRKSREAERKLVGDGSATMNARPSIGGIEVGGMKILGRNGDKLEVPQNMIAGSHGHGGYAEYSDPTPSKKEVIVRKESDQKGGKVQRVNDQELKELGLDIKTIRTEIKELQKAAKGKGWRLEIIEIEDGRELRGVIDGDETSEEVEYTDDGKGIADAQYERAPSTEPLAQGNEVEEDQELEEIEEAEEEEEDEEEGENGSHEEYKYGSQEGYEP